LPEIPDRERAIGDVLDALQLPGEKKKPTRRGTR
jgi:hypothetical protein